MNERKWKRCCLLNEIGAILNFCNDFNCILDFLIADVSHELAGLGKIKISGIGGWRHYQWFTDLQQTGAGGGGDTDVLMVRVIDIVKTYPFSKSLFY